nr:hypothetical protein [Desertimonas flava]
MLRANDRGSATVAAPRLYPHQWSWDAAFVAIGLAHLSPERACTELEHLLTGQWRTGMIPHIVYSAESGDYFPDAARWACADLTDAAPGVPATSGVTQPPIHGIAIERILRTPGGERAAVRDRVGRMWPPLMAWHRWLATARRSPITGLVTIVHGWESGMDNSPRFDEPYSRVKVPGSLPAYRRVDRDHVAEAGERPSNEDYDRYLWLIEELKAARYDDAEVMASVSFRVGDVFMTAVLAAASEALAAAGTLIDAPAADVDWLTAQAASLRAAVGAATDPATGDSADVDERTGHHLVAASPARFAALLCGTGSSETETQLVDRFLGDDCCGHPALFAVGPPSTSPASPAFEPTRYWRGPVWPVVSWLFWWALDRHGHTDAAAQLRAGGLSYLADGSFAEYYHPFTGAALGSRDQSWTAAVTVDWLTPT